MTGKGTHLVAIKPFPAIVMKFSEKKTKQLKYFLAPDFLGQKIVH